MDGLQKYLKSTLFKKLGLSEVNSYIVHNASCIQNMAFDSTHDVAILLHSEVTTQNNIFIDRQDLENALLNFSTSDFSLNIQENVLSVSCQISYDAFRLPSSFPTLSPHRNCKIQSKSSRKTVTLFSFYVNELLMCKQVSLPSEEYSFNKSGIVYIDFLKKTFNPTEYYRDDNINIQICIDDFQKAQYVQSSFEEALSVFSVICTVISMICLVITFVAMCLLPNKNTLPGKLFMSLMVALFVVQLMGIVGSFISTDIPCVVAGVISHYMWLTLFACSFVCSHSMYRLFSNFKPVYDQKRRDHRMFMIYTASSTISPIFFVAAYNIYSLYGDFGNPYHGLGCVITSLSAKIVFFIAPIAIISIINFILFCRTVYAIKSVPDTECTNLEKRNFRIFPRLFMITCATWLLQIIDGNISSVIVFFRCYSFKRISRSFYINLLFGRKENVVLFAFKNSTERKFR